MVNGFLRCGVGILGSAISLFMYGAPVGTFRKVTKKRTTGDMSGIPYAVGLFNCLVYTFYGSPLISNGWENALVIGINGAGLLLQCCFVVIYLLFAPSKSKREMTMMTVGVSIVFLSMVTIAMWGIHDDAHKKVLVGSTGMVATVILYGSPLSNIKLVLRTKSVEFMSFYFSLFAFLGSVLWLVYGALSKDILIMGPNFLGIPVASAQMIIYGIYKHRKQKTQERVDVEDLKVETEQKAEDIEVQIKAITA